MVEYSEEELSAVLKALSDRTRRDLLVQLCQHGSSRVTDLAKIYDMSLNAISKHIKVLESVGLVTRKTTGRSHWIEAEIEQIAVVERWFSQLKSIWTLRLDKLEQLLNTGEEL